MWFTQHEKLMKHVWYGVILLCAYLLQGVVFPWLSIRGASPLVLPSVAAAIALFEGAVPGGAWGLAAGMLCDASMNQPTLYFTLLMPVLCILVGLAASSVLAKGFPSCLVCSLCMLVICTLFQVVRPVLFRGGSPLVALSVGGIQILYSLIFCIPAYTTVRSACHAGRV